VFCGLGDFDKKYGYKWDDIVAYRYGLKEMQEKYNIQLSYSGKYGLDEYYDEDSLYYKKLEEFDKYNEVIKEKVLTDVKSDIGWYAEIIVKRMERIFNRTLPFHGAGWLFFPVILILFWRKEWPFIHIILASFALSLTPLIIFSKGNSTYNSVFPVFCTAMILYWITRSLINKKRIKTH
jgi:hypothetical protein